MHIIFNDSVRVKYYDCMRLHHCPRSGKQDPHTAGSHPAEPALLMDSASEFKRERANIYSANLRPIAKGDVRLLFAQVCLWVLLRPGVREVPLTTVDYAMLRSRTITRHDNDAMPPEMPQDVPTLRC